VKPPISMRDYAMRDHSVLISSNVRMGGRMGFRFAGQNHGRSAVAVSSTADPSGWIVATETYHCSSNLFMRCIESRVDIPTVCAGPTPSQPRAGGCFESP
jgi:hypothetical protein